MFEHKPATQELRCAGRRLSLLAGGGKALIEDLLADLATALRVYLLECS